jgi:hypothetical protein
MSKRIEAEFEVTGWEETPFDDRVGVSKLTEALVEKRYSGGIDGTSTTKWLMAYAPDDTATFVGVERIRGVVNGRKGSVVVLHDGSFDDGVARAELRVVSGTDELKDATGTGSFEASPAGSVVLTLD